MLWSDESSFQLFATPGNVRVRRRPGEEWNKDCIVPTVKHGSGSVMVWGCMSSSGVGRLTVCDGTISSEKYQAILRDTMLPAACEMSRIGQNYTFQQDNAPCHTSVLTRRWFQTNNVWVMD